VYLLDTNVVSELRKPKPQRIAQLPRSLIGPEAWVGGELIH